MMKLSLASSLDSSVSAGVVLKLCSEASGTQKLVLS